MNGGLPIGNPFVFDFQFLSIKELNRLMKSFPSTLNKGGSKINQPNASTSVKDALVNSFKNAFNSTVASTTSGHNFDTDGLRYSVDQNKKELLTEIDSDEVDFTQHSEIKYGNNQLFSRDNTITVENPFHMDQSMFNIINNYTSATTENSVLIENGQDTPDDTNNKTFKTRNFRGDTSHSLFNPYFGIGINGITRNVPLIDGGGGEDRILEKISDCSIKHLVELSGINTNNILGQARYKFADFMYCKDLGKISNNHLITLRRFAHPVADDIFTGAIVDKSPNWNSSTPGDIGRLISWFGTDDNKLEDIMSYEYDSTWKEMTAKIQQLDSQEDDSQRGIAGGIINMLSPSYLKQVGKGVANGGFLQNILHGMKFNPSEATYAHNDVALGRNYDNNKIYTPKNTMWDNHIYEGRIEFRHEFTLNFSYKLRAYDNINPKSAFLDLIGNIMRVTHVHGSFWGGSSQILGPQPDSHGWAKYNDFVDNMVNAGSTMLQSLLNGDVSSMQQFMGVLGKFASAASAALGNLMPGVVSAAKEAANGIINGIKNKDGSQVMGALKDALAGGGEALAKWIKNGGAEAIGGMLKNKLGRPALYAFDSLVPGSDMGYWHVTIGNPLNPIAVFGNLIMTNAKITHSGPLGIDDFPTELHVSCSLKHARPRDLTAIEKMYTKGRSAIYINHSSPFTKVSYKKSSSSSQRIDTSRDNTEVKKKKYEEMSVEELGASVSNYDTNTPQNLTAFLGDFSIERIRSNKELLRNT